MPAFWRRKQKESDFLSVPKNGEMDRALFSEDEFPEWIKDAVYSQRRRVHLNGKWAAMDEERAFRYFRKLGRCKKAQIILMSGTYANETRLPMIWDHLDRPSHSFQNSTSQPDKIGVLGYVTWFSGFEDSLQPAGKVNQLNSRIPEAKLDLNSAIYIAQNGLCFTLLYDACMRYWDDVLITLYPSHNARTDVASWEKLKLGISPPAIWVYSPLKANILNERSV